MIFKLGKLYCIFETNFVWITKYSSKTFEIGRNSCNRTASFARDRKKYEDKEVQYRERKVGVFGGNFQKTREIVRDREIFEIEGSPDRESPMYFFQSSNLRTLLKSFCFLLLLENRSLLMKS